MASSIAVAVGKGGINSNTAYDGLWRAHIKGTLPGGGAGEPPVRPPIPSGGYGASLSPADVDGIAKFLEEFTVRLLLPYLELRVRNLNHQVWLDALHRPVFPFSVWLVLCTCCQSETRLSLQAQAA